MNFGVYLCNFGDETSAAALAELAGEAENAGWNGFFLWDHMLRSTIPTNMVDPWITLTAVALKTTHIRFGTTLTPVCRRRPWHLARETTTLDILSNGRLILSVGLGDPADVDFAYFGEDPDIHVRAEKLDEGLDILDGLWSGKAFGYQGKHFHLEQVTFQPSPLQKPRIPIWVGGFWPNKAPFRRASRWDGVLPLIWRAEKNSNEADYYLTPDEVRTVLAYIRPRRPEGSPFETVIIGTRPHLGKKSHEARKTLAEFEAAGATWWLQGLYDERNSFEQLRSAIREGPPD